jgi:hypothetical protein
MLEPGTPERSETSTPVMIDISLGQGLNLKKMKERTHNQSTTLFSWLISSFPFVYGKKE